MTKPQAFCKAVMDNEKAALRKLREMEAGRARYAADGAWPDWCALPMAAAMAAVAEADGKPVSAARMRDVQDLTAAYLWCRHKQIYIFDHTLAQILTGQEITGDIPFDALTRLPVPCVYIEAPMKVMGRETEGFFAWLEYDARQKWPELRAHFLTGGEALALALPISGTLDQALDAYGRSAVERVGLGGLLPEQLLDRLTGAQADVFCRVINLLLYLCADDTPDAGSTVQRRRGGQAGAQAVTASGISQTILVGYRIGSTIRKGMPGDKAAQQDAREGKQRGHASPVPHVRRAHWHHFWHGPKDDPAKRELVLKWVPPVLVGAQDDDTATLHRVKG
ncbi:MAG: AcrVA2 family anti-CRISPR protein [Candidatus Ventricola sp.]